MSSPLRRLGRLVLLATTSLALAFPPGAEAVPAQPAGVDGNDYSWPQCPKGVGNGLGNPLPRGYRQFEIVGLTNGRGLHENPCLSSQWRYARAHADFVTGYTVPTYPTRRQRADARTGHYGRCSTLSCKLRNSGWAQGAFADDSLRRIGAHPPLVWVDVEPRYQQPWSGSRARNRLVVKAVIASLQHSGYRVGIYSTRYMWISIVGYATSVPEWVPSGTAWGGCHAPISRGPVWVAQYTHVYDSGNGYDENRLCRHAPRLTRMLQPAHPRVTTSHDRDTDRTFMRYSGGRRLSLNRRMLEAPHVVVAHRPTGDVPVFAGVDVGHRLVVRSLASRWTRVFGEECMPGASALARRGQMYVACRSLTGSLLLGQVGLGDDGSPDGDGVLTDLAGQLAGTPQLVVVDGVVTARATFTDGQLWQRTAVTEWQPAPEGTTLSPQSTARL